MLAKMSPIILFLFLALTLNCADAIRQGKRPNQVSCLDEEGDPVDWYIVYKLPQLTYQPAPFNSGYTYVYITSEDAKLSAAPSPIRSREESAIDGTTVDHVGNGEEPAINGKTVDHDTSFIEKFANLLHDFANFKFFKRGPIVLPSRAPINKSKSAESKIKSKAGMRWKLSDKSLVDPESLVMRTLSILYDKSQAPNLNAILYNDQPPENFEGEEVKVNSARAHAKGVVMIDDTTADSVWITHSFPQFPPSRDEGLNLGTNFKRNGQTLMCVNFDKVKTGGQVINHLINIFPLIYDSSISDRLYSTIPELTDLKLNGDKWRRKRIPGGPKLAQTITTMGGTNLRLFSKASDMREDMYSSWINDALESKLYVETWRQGKGTSLNSSCPRNDYHVNNVQDLKLDTGDIKVTWTYTMDHSKWAISDNEEAGLVCISDVNRMESQFKRGGGAICVKCPGCWSAFSHMIADTEPCPVKPNLG